MATEYKLSYTGQEIDEKLGKIVDLDTTLTQSGKTADAKAVGDAIENLSKEIDTIKNSMVVDDDDPVITAIAVTESADGTVTMVNTLEDGGTETLVISPDANGNPSKLTYNDTEIPITWTDNGYSGSSGYITVPSIDELPEDADDGTLAVVGG